MGILKKLNRHRKEAQQEAEKQKAEAFMSDYRELSRKHGIDFTAGLQVNQTGIIPVIKFIKVDATGKPIEK